MSNNFLLIQRIPVVRAVLVIMILGLGLGIYSVFEYRNVADQLSHSELLSDEEDYVAASKSINLAKSSWLVKLLGVKESRIKVILNDIDTRTRDHHDLQIGIEFGNNGDWDEGITRLLGIHKESFYYQRAQTEIEQLRIKILENELGIEQANRQNAENEVNRQIIAIDLVQSALDQQIMEKLRAESATERALDLGDRERLAKEESQREAVSQTARADREKAAKVVAQANTLEQQQRADREEAAKLEAQENTVEQRQRADREEAAKLEAQENTVEQRQRADREELAKLLAEADTRIQQLRAEKARVLELAATNPMIQAIVEGELKFFFEPLPTFAGSGVISAVEDISSSFSAWSPYGAIIRRVYTATDADLRIFWIKDYGTHTIGESIFKAHIKVGLGTDNCLGDWRAFDTNTVKKILWHEIGHSMGYGHSIDPNNVMYGTTDTKFVAEQDISYVIPGGWFRTFPLCNSGRYWYTFESDDSYRGFDLYVLPPGEEASLVSSGQASVYTDCGRDNMIRYTDSCNVALGAKIYVGNNGLYDAVRIDGEIISLDEPVWPNMEWDEGAFQYDNTLLYSYWDLFH